MNVRKFSLLFAPLLVVSLVWLSQPAKRLWREWIHKERIVYLDSCTSRYALEKEAFKRLSKELKENHKVNVVRVRVKNSRYPERDYLVYWRDSGYAGAKTVLSLNESCCNYGDKFGSLSEQANVLEQDIHRVADSSGTFENIPG